MPTYVYRCDQCGAEIERRQRFSDPPLTECETCAGALRRVLQPVGIIFKGSGFYSTDYKNGASKAKESGAETSTSSSSSNGESGSSSKTSTSSEKTSTSSESKPTTTSSSTTSSTTKTD